MHVVCAWFYNVQSVVDRIAFRLCTFSRISVKAKHLKLVYFLFCRLMICFRIHRHVWISISLMQMCVFCQFFFMTAPRYPCKISFPASMQWRFRLWPVDEGELVGITFKLACAFVPAGEAGTRVVPNSISLALFNGLAVAAQYICFNTHPSRLSSFTLSNVDTDIAALQPQ